MFRKVSKMFGGGESPAEKSESVQQVLGQRCVDLLTASVVSIESVDDASGKYDAFVIVVKSSSKEYRIRKRYSEFEAFRTICMSEIPDVYFPGKKFNLLQMNAEKLERRRGKLDKFLKAVLSCKTMTVVLQCDVLSFLDAFVNLSIDPGTPLFTYEAVSSTEFALKSSGQVSVAVVSVAKDIKADIVLYDVEISIAERTKYRVQHRFSAFQELHDKFKSVMPNLYFPGSLILSVDAQKQESRRVKLDVWLRTVMSASALPADLQRELLRFLDLFNKSGLHPQALLWPVLASGQQVVTAVEEDYERAVVRRQSVLDLHQASAILKEGYLIKRAVKTGSNWRKRYIKLYSDFFLGYCDNSDSAPKGLIPLTADHFVADNKLRPFGFHVSDMITSFYFQASSLEEKREWMQAILGAINSIVPTAPSEEPAPRPASLSWNDSTLKVYFSSSSAVDGSIIESSTRVSVLSDDTVESFIAKMERKNLLCGQNHVLNLEGPLPGPVPSDLLLCTVLSSLKEQGYDTQTKFRIISAPKPSRGPAPPLPPRPSAESASAQNAVSKDAVATEAAAAAAAASAAAAAAAATEAAAAEAAALKAAADREAELKQRQEQERLEMEQQQQLMLQERQRQLDEQHAREEAAQKAQLEAKLQAEADAAQRAVIEAAEKARLLTLKEEETARAHQQKLEEEQKHREEIEKLKQKQEAEAAALKRRQEVEEAAERKRLQEKRDAEAAALKLKQEQEAAERKRAAPVSSPPLPPKPASASPAQSKEDPPIRSVKSHWENFGKQHQEAQSTNVFSGGYDPTKAKHLKPGDPGYGRPPEGSQSEARAAKASDWVDNEIDKLIKVITDNGKSGTDGKVSITFGQLFILYQDISDSLVGIMMRAKKRSRLRYEGDMLWQGVHDAVGITVL